MNELSLFTGAGGGLLGTKLLGWKAIGYVEKEPYCQKVIRQRIVDGILDAAPIFGNIRKFISEGYAASYTGMVDVITGGFPCQDISCAGSGKGIEGERSGLWNEMSTVIRIVRPKYVFVENSSMLTVRGLGTVLRDLASMGFDAKWGVLGHHAIGGQHKRERIWIVAYRHKTTIFMDEKRRIESNWQRETKVGRKGWINFLVDTSSVTPVKWRSTNGGGYCQTRVVEKV